MTWTVTLVEEIILEAADTLRRLPRAQRPAGFRSAMPQPVASVEDMADWEPAMRNRVTPPKAEAIDRLDQVLGWMALLKDEQAKVVWARACGVPWRPICHKLGCGRTKAWQIWMTALVTLKARLNERAVPLPRRVA